MKTTTRVCANCRTANSPEADICVACGVPLGEPPGERDAGGTEWGRFAPQTPSGTPARKATTLVCPNCRAANSPGADLCVACGVPLGAQGDTAAPAWATHHPSASFDWDIRPLGPGGAGAEPAPEASAAAPAEPEPEPPAAPAPPPSGDWALEPEAWGPEPEPWPPEPEPWPPEPEPWPPAPQPWSEEAAPAAEASVAPAEAGAAPAPEAPAEPPPEAELDVASPIPPLAPAEAPLSRATQATPPAAVAPAERVAAAAPAPEKPTKAEKAGKPEKPAKPEKPGKMPRAKAPPSRPAGTRAIISIVRIFAWVVSLTGIAVSVLLFSTVPGVEGMMFALAAAVPSVTAFILLLALGAGLNLFVRMEAHQDSIREILGQALDETVERHSAGAGGEPAGAHDVARMNEAIRAAASRMDFSGIVGQIQFLRRRLRELEVENASLRQTVSESVQSHEVLLQQLDQLNEVMEELSAGAR